MQVYLICAVEFNIINIIYIVYINNNIIDCY